ncbi:MAG: hypothetical protein EOO08_03155 [Chitinophagaceae bacterium]|nr:MAG: hypothetical protein EOO08_03155 [Chitinophagaceae bacterium]
MKKPLLFSLLLLAACNPGRFRPISDFRINPKALHEEEPVKVIYYNPGLGNPTKDRYFSHIIVVSQETRDTVNVLAGVDHGLTEADKEKVYNFGGPGTLTYRLLFAEDQYSPDMDINQVPEPVLDFKKVAYNPQHQGSVRNNHPAIIGSLGIVTHTGTPIDSSAGSTQ